MITYSAINIMDDFVFEISLFFMFNALGGF